MIPPPVSTSLRGILKKKKPTAFDSRNTSCAERVFRFATLRVLYRTYDFETHVTRRVTKIQKSCRASSCDARADHGLCVRFQERPASSNGGGYIAADRLYDLNPMPAVMSSSAELAAAAAFGLSGRQAAASRTAEPNPVALLQYSAAYGNPYLQQRAGAAGTQPWPAPKLDAYGRPEPPPYSAVGRAKRKTPATATGHHNNNNNNINNAAATAVGANYHIGVAKRQTLATHV